jgi:hypothetical protein
MKADECQIFVLKNSVRLEKMKADVPKKCCLTSDF